MNHLISKTSGMLLLVVSYQFSGQSVAGEYNTGYFGNVAIEGYDPVAYFTERQAVKGSEDIALNWLGAEWKFSSEKHKTLFSENPIKYAPQFGGHCADGIAYGNFTSNIDPTAWRIIDGKLYLNADQGAAVEIEEVDGQIAKAEENWPKIKARFYPSSE